MDNRYGVLMALLAARLGRVAETTLRQAAAEADPPGEVLWQEFLINIGAIRQDEAASLEALAIDLLQVSGGDLYRAASVLQGGALLEMLSGAPPITPSPHDTTGAGLTAPMHQGHKEWLEVEQAVLPETPGRYRHISQHGKGGMGRVLLVHDASLGRDIALKELLSDLETGSTGPDTPLRKSTEVTARFLQEAFVTARLEHPNIVPVYEVGRRPAGNLFYTMRLVRGKTLGQAIGSAKSMTERLALIPNFLSLCHAIAYAHSRKVIHRDIKPSNIMVGEFGETVVLDWGVAKVRDAEDPFSESIRSMPEDVETSPGAWLETEYGTAVGTPQYMSPEQAMGQLDEVDERSDVYALGVVLYEILAGVPPYKAKSLHALLLDVSRGDCAPLSETAPDAPPELVSICARAMNKTRDMRYRSAAALADEVERWQAGLLVRAYEYRFPELVKRYYEKHKPLVHTIGTAGAVILGVLVLSYWSIWNARDREREERIAAEKHGYRSQMLLAQSHADGRRFGAAQNELDNAKPPLRHIEWGLLAALCAQDVRRVTAARPLMEAHFAGADGTSLLTRDMDGAVQLWDAADALSETWQFPALGVRSIEISPDGRFAVAAVTDGALHRIALQPGGENQREGGGAILNHAVFSPDGSEIGACDENGLVRFLDAETLEERARWRTRANQLRMRYSPAGGSVLLWSEDHVISVRSRDTGNELYQFAGERPEWSADGRAIAFRDGVDGGIALPEEQRVIRLAGHTDLVRHAVFSPDGTRVLTASNDDTARLWEFPSGRLLRVLVVGANPSTCAITSDSATLAIWTEDNYLRVYPADEEAEPLDYTGHASGMGSGKLSADGRYALSCSMDGTARVWDISRPAAFEPLSPAPGDIASAFLGENSGLLGAIQWNGPLMLASADTGASLGGARVRGPIFGNDAASGALGKRVTAALDAFTPMVWEPGASMPALLLREPWAVQAVAMDEMERYVATARWDGSVSVWSVESGERKALLEGLGDTASNVCFARDGGLVAASNYDGEIIVWDWAAGSVVRRLTSPPRLFALTMSADGTMLAAASSNEEPLLWNLATEAPPQILVGQAGLFQSLEFTHEGRRLVSAASDGASGIWDTESGELLSRLPGYTGRMMWAAYSDSRQSLYTAGEKAGPYALRRWPAAPWDVAGIDAAMTGFRAKRAAEKRTAEDTGESYIAATPERWQAALEVLQRMLGRGDAPAVEGRSEALALAGIGIAPGSEILSIGGTPLAEGEAALAALASAEPPVIVVRERGAEYALRIRLHEPASETVSMTFTKAEIIGLLLGAENFLSFRNEGIVQLTEEYWTQLTGSPEPLPGYCGGAWINAPLEKSARADMRKFGLGAGDEIVRIDGACVEGLDGLRLALRALRERVEASQEPMTFAMDIHRGEFQRTTLSYTITP